MRKNYQRKDRKSNHKLEMVGRQELLVRVPLPMAEVWAEMQARVEELAGQAGLQILRAILENEVAQWVGPPHRPDPSAGCGVGESSRVNPGYGRARAKKHVLRSVGTASSIHTGARSALTCCFPKGSVPSFLLETKMAVQRQY